MNLTPEAFSQVLREALRTKFGRPVTAAFLARELDLYTKGQLILSSEAVRRWMVGISLPRAQVLVVLDEYLGRSLVHSKVSLDLHALTQEELQDLHHQVSARLTEVRSGAASKR